MQGLASRRHRDLSWVLELVRYSCVTSYPRFQQLGSSRHFQFPKVTAWEWPRWVVFTWGLLRRSWSSCCQGLPIRRLDWGRAACLFMGQDSCWLEDSAHMGLCGLIKCSPSMVWGGQLFP